MKTFLKLIGLAVLLLSGALVHSAMNDDKSGRSEKGKIEKQNSHRAACDSSRCCRCCIQSCRTAIQHSGSLSSDDGWVDLDTLPDFRFIDQKNNEEINQ